MLQPLDIQEQQRLVLGGMGGIGKTQLAIAYAKSCHQTYDSVFWLNAESEATLQDSFLSVAKQIFRLQQPDKLQAEDAVIHTCQWLSDTRNTRWLLILDNYDDPNIFKIEQYCPFASHGVVLITTRQPILVAGKKILIRPIQDIEDSLIILQSRSKRESTRTDPHAKRLAERLAGLPLALATAGAFLQHSTITFQRYLQEYERCWNIDPRRPTRLEEYQDRTLFTTWDLSYRRVQDLDPDAAELLKLLAYFSNQSLWHGLFSAGLTNATPQWLHDVADNEISFDSVMKTLTDHCFLEVQTSIGSWSMHGCVHDWALNVLNKNIDPKQYQYALNCVAASIPSDSTDSLGHPSFFYLAAHGTRLDQHKDISHVANLLHGQIQLVAAGKMYQQALAGQEKTLGPDHISTLGTVHNLGNLYFNQGKLQEAEEMYQQALAGYKKALGPDHTSTLSTVNNLGVLYFDQGRLQEAEEMYQQALAGYCNGHLWNHSWLRAWPTTKIQAIACDSYKKALGSNLGFSTRIMKALGPDHTFTLGTVHNLGNLDSNQGKLQEAEEMYQRALAGYKKALGPEHSKTCLVANNLVPLAS
ncbi:P-loop containing nucleoside triphosphate hydrolase protein [Aspergillus filifer]